MVYPFSTLMQEIFKMQGPHQTQDSNQGWILYSRLSSRGSTGIEDARRKSRGSLFFAFPGSLCLLISRNLRAYLSGPQQFILLHKAWNNRNK